MTLQKVNRGETMLAELPESIVTGAQKLRATETTVRAFTTLQPVTRLERVSMAEFAALLSRYKLRAELEATDRELSVRMCRSEDLRVAS
jgi:hypothetical protein